MKNIESCAAESGCEYVNGIKLTGSEKFIEKTKRALLLMPTEYLDFAVEHLGEIYETEQSGVMPSHAPARFGVGKRTWDASLTWYASCIVHDANHVWLYRKGEPHSGKEPEARCMEKQIAFLEAISAPKSEIAHLKNLIKTGYDYWSDRSKITW